MPEPGLWKALNDLPRIHREVVVLRFILDWSEAEVADALGLRLGTVKSRTSRAIAQLREELT